MAILIQEIPAPCSPEEIAQRLQGTPGLLLLRSGLLDSPHARFSFVVARPFLTFRSYGARCELHSANLSRAPTVHFGDPWRLLEHLMSRYELLEQLDLPFPLGGCFGYWGYELKNFLEPKLSRRAGSDLEIPDSQLGFYGSLLAFDHRLSKAWVIATGLDAEGLRSRRQAESDLQFWQEVLEPSAGQGTLRGARTGVGNAPMVGGECPQLNPYSLPNPRSNLSREDFISRVEQAQRYIRSGDIYQVNLSQRLTAEWPWSGWELFQRLSEVSPAPFSAWLDCGPFQLVSSSPELFLRMSGSEIQSRPIKGTRPRAAEPSRDARLAYELQTSPKEIAELVMITDLLRNDLGKVCEFGSVQTPELLRLERYAQVQHLVSTVSGRLRPALTHLSALASCFPGGSITGAPKFRAMQIIDELEPVSRGPYTGALGYLGFNRESQLSIIIRSAICQDGLAHFPVGAGIVSDSGPAAEYEETLAKAQGFYQALRSGAANGHAPRPGTLTYGGSR